MSYIFSGLKPERMWFHFHEICQIPRASKKEDKIRQYLVNWGKSHNLETLVDETGNVVIRKPATTGMENRKAIVLQSHMDMVCEKNSNTVFNFDTDAIVPRIEGEWVKATGTTLGADNGIGIAAQLAVLEASDLKHGPLECLITTDEETGLTGAFGLKPKLLKGSIMLNLDSEEEGEITIGCAGGKDTIANITLQKEAFGMEYCMLRLEISGLLGGHSGDEINKGRGNSLKILSRILLYHLQYENIRLLGIGGGNLRNAIPREAWAEIAVPNASKEQIIQSFQKQIEEIRIELKYTDPNLKLSITERQGERMAFTNALMFNVLRALHACPNGVLGMSPVIPGLVETSSNLAAVKINGDVLEITSSQRSSIMSARNDAAAMIGDILQMAGGVVSYGDGYPGWSPNPDSAILKAAKATYLGLFGKEPIVKAIHAGLECGLIGETYPEMDMISFGPTIMSPHSPDERIQIDTVKKFWDYLCAILEQA